MSFIVCGSCSELIMSNIHVCKQTSRNIQICKNCEYLEKENQHLKSQLALCVEVLEIIQQKQDESDIIQYGLMPRETMAKECLDKLAAMQSEGEK